jgi:AraC-like DNA-binding protein
MNAPPNPPLNPVAKALWFIENNFAGELTLDEIADVAGVSRYHVSRAFGEALGRPITRYVRGRRLTEAAKALVAGATDILTVALESGYGSHEAFTRAFREQFGQTPESVRAQRHLDNLELVEAHTMDMAAAAFRRNGSASRLTSATCRARSAATRTACATTATTAAWIICAAWR